MTFEALRRGEPQVLAELLSQYGREIQGVAYLILRNRADAEDVLMDTLLTALDRGSSLRDPSAMRQWLLKIATNQALSRRRRFRRVTWVQLAPDAPGPAMDTTEHVALVQGLATLPIRSRAAVVLHYYADLPFHGLRHVHTGDEGIRAADRVELLDSAVWVEVRLP